MPPTLGAALCIHKGETYDFCYKECIESLLPVCDEVVIAEGESNDGTREVLDEWALREPKLRVVDYPFAKPSGDSLWVMNFYNHAREHLNTDLCITLDCDEVIEEGARDKIMEKVAGRRVSLRVRRWNFWKDAQHLVPANKCLAAEVIRVAPKELWIPADIPVPQGQACMDIEIPALNIQVFHYGFLRKRESFFKKERFLQTAFTGGYDPRLDVAEKSDGNWMTSDGVVDWLADLQPFTGKHPNIIHSWLSERGYTPNP